MVVMVRRSSNGGGWGGERRLKITEMKGGRVSGADG